MDKILTNINKNEEFEILYNVNKKNSIEDIKLLVEYCKNKLKKTSKKSVILDIFYNNFRISIQSIHNINTFFSFFEKTYSNKEILNNILSMNDIIICKKKVIFKKIIEEQDVKYKLSSELDIDKKELQEFLQNNISKNENIILFYRYKERVTIPFYKNKKYSINLDLSITKQNSSIYKLLSEVYHFEIELELFSFVNENKIDKKNFYKIHDIILNVLHKSKIVLQNYQTLLNTQHMYTMNPFSLDKNTYIEKIPFHYSVTDKADGEKIQLIIYDKSIYGMTINNEIFDLGKTHISGNFIVEGEKIKERILLYDILYYKNKDIRNNNLKIRLQYLDEFITLLQKKKNFKFNFDVDKIDKNIQDYIQFISSHDKIIEKKYILLPTGFHGKEEIYHYAQKIWNSFKSMPYELDGIIFTHIEQEYQKSVKLQKFPIYKWKPMHLNSIDFYIIFDQKQNLINIQNKLFKMIYLYNYDKNTIIPFKKNDNLHIAYVECSDNNNFKDKQNNVIKNKTIVEMIYIKDNIWEILRTRDDKTKYMLTNKTKYGNHISIAENIFSIIKDPFDLIFENKDNNKYYEKKSNIGKEMRSFHNNIKNYLIQTFCKNKNVLDVGIGKGGDIYKYHYAKIKSLVAIEPSYYDLIEADDSAINRYDALQKKNKNVPKMIFVHSDFGLPLMVTKQHSIDKKNKNNSDNIKEYLKKTKKYDVINFSFSFHYLYTTQYKKQLFQNINDKLIKKKGFLLLTMFDADKILSFLDKETQKDVYYNDKIFFSIRKTVDKNEIELYNSIYNENNTFYKEPIIFSDILQKELKEKCNLKLIETKLFEDYLEENKVQFSNYLNSNNSEDIASLQLSKLYRYYVFSN